MLHVYFVRNYPENYRSGKSDDSCVVNKMINGKQCTIGWHVDDVRCSYVDPMVVDHMIDLMSEEFGTDAPLTASRDKVHEYLGTKFDLTKDGAVTIDMSDHVKKIVAEMPEEMVGKTPTPAANHLFKIREGSVPIERRKPTRSIKSSCSCSISGNKDDRIYGLQYHSCASG